MFFGNKPDKPYIICTNDMFDIMSDMMRKLYESEGIKCTITPIIEPKKKLTWPYAFKFKAEPINKSEATKTFEQTMHLEYEYPEVLESFLSSLWRSGANLSNIFSVLAGARYAEQDPQPRLVLSYMEQSYSNGHPHPRPTKRKLNFSNPDCQISFYYTIRREVMTNYEYEARKEAEDINKKARPN